MKADYSITKSAIVLEDGNCIVTYGIEAKDICNGETLDKFSDVSVNRKFTEHIIDILNGCNVELCHFHDIITDELNR